MTAGTPAASRGDSNPNTNQRWDRSFFCQTRRRSTRFLTEIWERFSYNGMRALLILFMTATVANGGLGMPTSKAGAVYGLYTSMVYLMGVPGGWVADRITGHRRAVFSGGVIIALGHFSMAIPTLNTFYLGLVLIVAGTGLLKPNISTMVGELYSETDARRDAGVSIFYMGINLGGLIAPLVCGYLGENINWHYGFGAAGVGMTLGLIQYSFGGKYLGNAGLAARGTAQARRIFWICCTVAVALVAAAFAGWVNFSAEALSAALGVVLIGVSAGVFGFLLTRKGYSPIERRRIWAVLVLFIASCAFWSAFEQAGSTLNLFAERNTNLHAWDFPLWGLFRASYFQALNSIFIVALAPVAAWLWIRLGKREPPTTLKFVLGLIFVGLGFAILVPVANGTLASPWWLTLTYLLHTVGELCLSPVGLSATTKLAPARIAGFMMGVWYLSLSIGDYVGGELAAFYETFPLPKLFGSVAAFCVVVGLLLVLMIRPMKKLMSGIQ